MGSEQQAVAKTQQATVNEAVKTAPKTEHAENSMLATEGPPHDFGRVSLYGPPPAQPRQNRAPFVGRDAQGQLEIQEGDPSARRRPAAGQYLRHGATVERENQIRAEHNIPARGYRLRDPYCGESYYRDRAAPATMHWQDAQDNSGDTYLQHCEYLRSQLPENRNGRYRIDELIPEGAAASEEGVIQRKCDCGGECPKCKAAAHAAHDVPSIVHENLQSAGQPLDSTSRAYFGQRFGHDFSNVKVHNDARAHASARAVHAAAYTVGSTITFGAGQYQPGTAAGRRLLAHELTHVVQQQQAAATPQAASLKLGAPAGAAEQEASRIADAIGEQGSLPPVTAQPALSLARAPFDVEGISAAVNSEKAKEIDPKGPLYPFWPAMPVTRLFSDFGLNPPQGEITMAADYPSTFKKPTDTSRLISPEQKTTPDSPVPLSNIPVEAHFFPSVMPAKGKALVVGGFHGDERPGFQATDALVEEMRNNFGAGLAFNTIVIPRFNAGAIKDELDGVKFWRNRCNRQRVDLNRDFPTGAKGKDTDCPNTGKAPRQPETVALINLIEKFKPDRIVSVHAISTPSSAGIFADPADSKEAVELARGMATTLVNPSDRPANQLGTAPDKFNAVYPLDRGKKTPSAGTSLGAWAPKAARPGETTPVITIEAPKFKDLGKGRGDEARTVEGFVRPLRAFLDDPDKLTTAADRDILKDIDAFDAADRVAFLTGIKPANKNDILKRIKFRVDTAIASLNAMKPPVRIKAVSDIRLFSDTFSGNTSQSQIVFEKFFLSGSRARGWDTLPNAFFNKGDRSKGVDRSKWLGSTSKERLDIILKFSALPGTSRHHWGTEVDLNSVEVADWKPGKKDSLADLDTWLQANAPKVGLIQSYTAGRKGGYSEEPWHYSYAPIAEGLRKRYNREVKLDDDVRNKIKTEFEKRAKAIGETLPADFESALVAIDVGALVNDIGPGL
ncbi:DUF4157 domain-containing protein [uncultured Chitinophaga sp.]|jgi:D-alanyl-D-alanine carboxypeptidase|uniref:eCIS core domain-containing protein n=1 Tax=uncultured Chitinophaga sp. TaxID=339340 RepID=UPI00260C8C8F|nr:DUF4157 domain-containing protein [uncultured Chitinophaga sp.]